MEDSTKGSRGMFTLMCESLGPIVSERSKTLQQEQRPVMVSPEILSLCLRTEDIVQSEIEIRKCPDTVTRKAGAVHDGERRRLQIGEFLQILCGQRSVRHIGGQNAGLIFLQRPIRAANNVRRGEWFDVAGLMKQIRTEQRSLRFLEEHSGVLAVGQMRSLAIAEAEFPGRKGLAISEGP